MYSTSSQAIEALNTSCMHNKARVVCQRLHVTLITIAFLIATHEHSHTTTTIR